MWCFSSFSYWAVLWIVQNIYLIFEYQNFLHLQLCSSSHDFETFRKTFTFISCYLQRLQKWKWARASFTKSHWTVGFGICWWKQLLALLNMKRKAEVATEDSREVKARIMEGVVLEKGNLVTKTVSLNLLHLPPEMLAMVASYLDLSSYIALAKSCSSMLNTLTPHRPQRSIPLNSKLSNSSTLL